MNKHIIQTSFNKASRSYDGVASMQRSCGQLLVSELQQYSPDFYPDTVLDVGSGTGYIIELLSKIYPLSNFTLNDLSQEMIKMAKNKLLHMKNINFIVGDMEKQEFKSHDLIISNLAMQWASNINNVISKLYNISKIYVFTCLIDGTFKEWEQIFDSLSIDSPIIKHQCYDSIKSHIISLNPKRYNLYTKKYTLTFETLHKFMRYLKNLGAVGGVRTIRITDLRRILNLHLKNFSVSYEVLFSLIER